MDGVGEPGTRRRCRRCEETATFRESADARRRPAGVEITAESTESFEDAVRHGIAKASETVHDIRSAWVESQQVKVERGHVVAYRVDLKVTFVLE